MSLIETLDLSEVKGGSTTVRGSFPPIVTTIIGAEEQFTNLTSESEFTPSETLDLISITVDKPIKKNSNKIGIIIGSTIGGVLLLILISVLLYLHFIKKAF